MPKTCSASDALGLYDDRLYELSESRRGRRVGARRGPFAGVVPALRRAARPFSRIVPAIRRAVRPLDLDRPERDEPAFTRRPYFSPAATEAAPAARPSMDIQSLLFGLDAGWTESKAKQWAKTHGYKYGKTDVTDQYIRIRQFDPSGLKVKRTITLGRGIRAVVAREEDTAMKRRRTTKKRSSRRSASAASAAKPAFGTPAWRAMYPRKGKGKRKARRAREATAVAVPRKRRHARRARETSVAARRTKRRRTDGKRRGSVRRYARSTTVAAPRKRRHARRVRAAVAAPRKRRRKSHRKVRAWYGNAPGHRKAAKKGHSRKRKPARRRMRETIVAAPRKRRRTRRTHARASTYAAAPRKRRRSHRAREASVVKSSHRRRRSYRTHAVGGGLKRIGKQAGMLALAIGAAGAGYTLADWIDRYLATYNPELSGDKLPKDKFTSDGTGMLANSLNVAAPPPLLRIGAIVAMVNGAIADRGSGGRY